jgi:DNA-binding transcriptional regulator YhcF (GntR family)
MIKTFLMAIGVAIALLVGFTVFTLSRAYADGERAGFVQKLSKKGWICKTWEGEMAMVTMPGTVAEKIYFTVPDDAVASRINTSVGNRVSLHYEEHKWIPFSCFGDTGYFVTDVRAME